MTVQEVVEKISLAVELPVETVEEIKRENEFKSDAQVRQQLQVWVIKDTIPRMLGENK